VIPANSLDVWVIECNLATGRRQVLRVGKRPFGEALDNRERGHGHHLDDDDGRVEDIAGEDWVGERQKVTGRHLVSTPGYNSKA